MQSDQPQLTQLLVRMRSGDPSAAAQAMQAVYADLHQLAAGYMYREGSGHTLQPTALVHEAFLRLMGGAGADIQDRNHFFALAAQTMRRVLVDHAREKRAAKRGGGAVKVEMEDFHAASEQRHDLDVLAVDQCLQTLAQLDQRAARVVELRFFGGYTDKEVAEILNEKPAVVRADWDFAKAWLRTKLGAQE